MMGRLSQWTGCLLLCVVQMVSSPEAMAAEEPTWIKLVDFAVPASALRVYGNALPPTPAAERLWKDAKTATGAWANPVVCRVNYRRTFVPGEVDLDQGVCVLFMHTRLGGETACTSRDSVCRIHVPLSAGVEVLGHAGAMHLIPLTAEAKAPRGTVALDVNGLTGKWRLCLQGSQVGATEQSKVACMTGSGGVSGGVDFAYGDTAATEKHQLDALARWVGERRTRLSRVLVAAQAAQSISDIDKALVAVESVGEGADAELAPLLEGLVGAGEQEAQGILERGLGDVTRELALEAETLKRRRQVAEALANVDALVARIEATLVSARHAEGGTAEVAAFVEVLDGYASSLDAVLNDGGLANTVHAQRVERLTSLSREIVAVLESLEPRLSSGDRTARLAHHVKRLASPPVELMDLPAAVTVFRRLQKASDPFRAQRDRLAIVDGLRGEVLEHLTEGLYADMKDPERGPRAHLATTAGFVGAFEGWRSLPESMEVVPEDDELGVEARRMGDALRAAGLSWRWEVPESVPAWDAAWSQREAVVDPAVRLARRVAGPLDLTKTQGWLASSLGDALDPVLKYWFVCLGVSELEGASPLAVHIAQCIAAQDGLGPMVDDEPLGDASEPLEAVEAEWTRLLGVLGSADLARCKRVLQAHEAHRLAGALEETCAKAKVADKEHAKDRRAQKKVAKSYGRMMKAMGASKWRKASKSLKAMRKQNKRGVVDDALIASWGESIAHAQAAAERRKEEAAAEKRRARAQKKARKRADKLMRKLPRYESQCSKARQSHSDAVTRSGTAALAGDRARVKKFNALKEKTRRLGCDAQAEVLIVFELYRQLGLSEAAEAAKKAAPSCLQGWRCP